MLVVFFFFKQKTAYEMRIGDWSSDVCSSDLIATSQAGLSPAAATRASSRSKPAWHRSTISPCQRAFTKATRRASRSWSEMRERPSLMLGSCQRGCTLSCGQAPGRLLERRQGALDHVVGGGQADAEVLRRLQHAARHDEDVAVGQGIEQRVAVAAGGAADRKSTRLNSSH